MNNLKSYWKLSEHPFDFPTLVSAKQELLSAVDYEINKQIYDGTTIEHIVNGKAITRIVATVSPEGRVKFSRPQRL